MKRGKYECGAAPKRGGRKAALLLLAMLLALGGVIGSTAAWLSAQTEPVVNTFTYGDINIELEETDTEADKDDDPNTNTYKMLPGETITKDPKVTVLAGSEDCWLFVKLEKSENFDDFLTYQVDVREESADGEESKDGWIPLDGVEGVYYRAVAKSEENQEFLVIKGNTVSVRDDVTKDMLNALDETPGAETYPTLTITAYAVQYNLELEPIDSAEKAWALVTADQDGQDGEETVEPAQTEET